MLIKVPGIKSFVLFARVTLFAGSLAQRVVDTVLPARSVFLEEIEHVAVDAQRNHLLGARDRGLLGGQVRGLGRRRLERTFGGFARIDRPAWLVVHSDCPSWIARNLRWLPSQKGGCLFCWQPKNATVRFSWAV